MDRAKVQLSGEEMALVKDPGIILTKNSVIRKTVELFAALNERYQGMWKADGLSEDGSPVEIRNLGRVGNVGRYSGKISKGENYKGLPYVVLDYPRAFGREDVLAIRTLFWWGHYFSITLHLKGSYQAQYLPAIRRRLPELAAAGFHLAIGDDEWRHELTADNYQRIGMMGDAAIEKILTEHPFVKLSVHCGLDKWENAAEILSAHFRMLAGVLND